MKQARYCLNTIFRRIVLISAAIFLITTIPTVFYFHSKTRRHEIDSFLLSTLQSNQGLTAQIRDAVIQNNYYLTERLLEQLKTNANLIDARFVKPGAQEDSAACRARPISGTQILYCELHGGTLSLSQPLGFANRPYGEIRMAMPVPPLSSRFWFQAFGIVIALSLIGLVSSYCLGLRVFRNHVLSPILSLLDRMRRSSPLTIDNIRTNELHGLYEAIEELIRKRSKDAELVACGQMASEIAHDMKQPLSAIRTMTSKALERFEEKEFRADFSKDVPDAVNRLARLSDQMLELARNVELVRQVVDMNQFIQECVKEYCAANGQFSVTFEGARSGSFSIDSEVMRRVFLNLLENATAAMKNRKGRIRVRLADLENPEKGIQIQVKDDGIGIPERELHRIFDPFYSKRKNGIGLGLAICRKFVNLHVGEIFVRSREGRGSTFYVNLYHRGEMAA